ncbi:DUF2784 domain-containing protein [Spongiactinospora rosea]|uniref:DUF2784 domain-containing protein n=1 Tax=Spongiactinospora rosea TaxID=2248750 RepID=A0A366M4M5_9ACTN|nr:DUF2784 domain-containing protein [Spongiactinospora rosea]RBQ20392.1 DUF2784 domain-containing protein [Spongiactinospora rosea]
MGYRLVGDGAMVVHFLFLAYMALGGFLAWWLPRSMWAHAAVAAWGLISITTGVECPLTALENWGRTNAGLAGLGPNGFIDHYIEGIIYPEEYTTLVRWIVAALVLVSWIGYGTLSKWRGGRRRPVERASSEGLTSA